MKQARDLPQSPEAMQSASIEDLEQILNQPRDNYDMIQWVHEAVNEVKARGYVIEGSGEGPYRIVQRNWDEAAVIKEASEDPRIGQLARLKESPNDIPARIVCVWKWQDGYEALRTSRPGQDITSEAYKFDIIVEE